MHTIILGNGILGLTTAFRLLQAGGDQRITLIGPARREGSATLAAAAMLNSFAEIEAGSLDHEVDLYRFELSHRATEAWPDFAQQLSNAAGSAIQPLCFTRGTYVISNTAADAMDDENFAAIIEALEVASEPHAHIDPASIPNYLPEARHRATRAVRIDNEGWLNPRRVIATLDAVLHAAPNVTLIDQPVTRLHGAHGIIRGAELADGTMVEGDQYLLATGATVSELLRTSALDMPMQPVFYGIGTSVEIKSPDAPHTHCIRTPNRGLACGVYTVPYDQGPDHPNDHLVVGASNFIAPTPQPYGRLGSVEALTRAAMEQINRHFYRAGLVRVNVGWRPTSQDTYPLLGRSASYANLVVATGTKRDGFHLAPVISQLMADLLRGREVETELAVFAPERAPLRTLTREQAIEKAARHQMSAAYQHGFVPAKSRMPEQLHAMYRDAAEQLHDTLGITEWGIPPEMLDMYRYGHAKP